jgi:hypothetical protein
MKPILKKLYKNASSLSNELEELLNLKTNMNVNYKNLESINNSIKSKNIELKAILTEDNCKEKKLKILINFYHQLYRNISEKNYQLILSEKKAKGFLDKIHDILLDIDDKNNN